MSSGGDVKYTQSKEQRRLLNAIMPMVQGLGQYGQQRYFGDAPQMGAPSMGGVLTSQPMYDIPDPSMAMPTANWWGSLSPNVKAGLYAPYVEAGQGLMEMMGSKGQMGSPMGGFSGAGGAALGELAGQAAQNVGLDAWKMTAPMAMAGWNANLARNQMGYQQGQQERLADYQTSMDVWNRPMSLMGMAGLGMPQGYTDPSSGGMGGLMAGGLMGGLGAAAAFPGSWPLIGAGALMGGLGGLF
jgi:hypothetical protein